MTVVAILYGLACLWLAIEFYRAPEGEEIPGVGFVPAAPAPLKRPLDATKGCADTIARASMPDVRSLHAGDNDRG